MKAAEDGRVAQFSARCKKLGDLPKLVKEIEESAHFPKSAKVLLCDALPKIAARALNASGISSEYQDVLAVVTALLLILKQDRATSKRLDELIAQLVKTPPADVPMEPSK